MKIGFEQKTSALSMQEIFYIDIFSLYIICTEIYQLVHIENAHFFHTRPCGKLCAALAHTFVFKNADYCNSCEI